MTSLELYFINSFIDVAQVVEMVDTLILICSVIGFLLLCIVFTIGTLNNDKDILGALKILRPIIFKLGIVSITIAGLLSFVPNKKEMLGIYLIPKIANNQSIQSLPPLLTEWLTKKAKDK